MRHRHHLISKIAPGLLVLFFSSSSVISFMRVIEFVRGGPAYRETITAHERRFAGLKKFLPGRGIAGYVAEKPAEEIFFDRDASEEYYLTQYALTPLIIENNPDCSLVVGNFRSAEAAGRVSPEKFTVLADLKNGVVLLRRAAE